MLDGMLPKCPWLGPLGHEVTTFAMSHLQRVYEQVLEGD